MPALFDSSSSATQLIAGGAASGSKSLTHNGSTLARDRFIAYVGVFFTGEVNTTFATFTATFGGTAMTQIGTGVTWDTYKGCLHVFKLEDAPRGSQTVVAGFTGMPTELVSRNFEIVVLTYSGVDTVSDPVTAGSTTATANTADVTSVKPAHRVLSFHGVGKGKTFSAYNQTKRQQIAMVGGGSLLAGDAPGAATVTCTATQASTNQWGVIAVAMTPSVVEIEANLSVQHLMTASMATFRVATPHPDREYTVPPTSRLRPRAAPTAAAIMRAAGGRILTATGVLMPVFVKDVDDTLDYTFHWAAHLADDDEIISVQHTVPSPLRVFSEIADGEMTQVWVDGGATTVHPLRIRFGTRRGRRHDFIAYILGVDNF